MSKKESKKSYRLKIKNGEEKEIDWFLVQNNSKKVNKVGEYYNKNIKRKSQRYQLKTKN